MLTLSVNRNVSHTSGDVRKRRLHCAYMTIGKRIKDARKAKRLTQAQLADALGVERAAVTQWETDKTVPSPSNWPKLAAAVDRDVDWLMSGDDRREAAATLIDLYGRLDDEKKALLMRLATELGKKQPQR